VNSTLLAVAAELEIWLALWFEKNAAFRTVRKRVGSCDERQGLEGKCCPQAAKVGAAREQNPKLVLVPHQDRLQLAKNIGERVARPDQYEVVVLA